MITSLAAEQRGNGVEGGVVRALHDGVNERDPITFGAVTLAILSVSALACLPSLFRLRRIKPADCVRSL